MLELRIDFHVHTDHSDSISSVKEIIESARKKNLDGIAITDHDTMTAVKQAQKLAHDLIIIPGIEIGTEDGHLLVLGLTRPPPLGLSSIEVAEYTRKKGGVVIIAHPNVPFYSFKKEIIKKILPDAIETYNAKTPFSKWLIKRNVKLAKQLHLPQIGGSDSHMHQTVGDMYTLVYASSKSEDDILKAVRRGAVKPAGKPSSFWERPIRIIRLIHRKLHKIVKLV